LRLRGLYNEYPWGGFGRQTSRDGKRVVVVRVIGFLSFSDAFSESRGPGGSRIWSERHRGTGKGGVAGVRIGERVREGLMGKRYWRTG
jgi:hypothetical protein